ncbi:MAG: phospholipase D family protein [Syntrophales bacterium]|nr:phospholipase D family protein [Syntrophales bacterium]HPL62942.1 phospholipase D family protein [Syntrophales bacterium]
MGRLLRDCRALFIFIAVLLVSAPIPLPGAARGGMPEVVVLFSPGGGCADAIAEILDGAESEILVQAYSFTSAPIAKRLVDAHKRGVKVRVILDKSQQKERYTSATFLFNAGVPVMIDSEHAIAHNKVIVVDAGIVITGSYNFTKAAEKRNAENLLIIRSAKIAKKYRDNWLLHSSHSRPYFR